MAQTQFRSDDTQVWTDKYGAGGFGAGSINTSTDATANDTLTGTSGGTSATVGSGSGFSNGDLVIIHQTQGTGFGNWELNKISSGGGTTSWTMIYTLKNTYGAGAQVYLLKQYSTFQVNTSQTLTSLAWNGSKGGILAVLANQSITIPGTIALNGNGYRGGVNGLNQGVQGESGTGVGSGATAANGAGGGGGQASTNWGGGGGGGNGAVGSDTTVAADRGFGGGTAGVAGLTTVVLGGSGGGAARDSGGAGGTGGNGGGFIILISPTITITGGINLNGSVGANGTSPKIGGGGGGAGGSALLKGQIITLGSNLITATAGAGGTQSGQGDAGGAGGVGRIHVDILDLANLSGTTSPTLDSRQDTSLASPTTAGFIFNLI